MKAFGTDYDGVIINIEAQKAKAFGKLINKTWGVNQKEARDFWIEKGGTSRKYKFDYFYEKAFKKQLSDDEYKRIEIEFSRILKNEFYPRVKLLDGALELLKFCRENFDHTFVSSGVTMEEIKYLVELNGLSNYFDLTLGTDFKFISKNEHFNEIKRIWRPDEVYFLADGLEDMKIAKSFKFYSIGITTNHSKKDLENAGASEVVDNLSQATLSIKKLVANS
nr:HAD family hydrolase [Candidatus Levybacteria bacterium]